MNPLEKYSDEDLLNALIETAHRVSNPSESNFLSDIRAVLAERLTKRAADGATPRAYCNVHEIYYDVSMGCAACPPRR